MPRGVYERFNSVQYRFWTKVNIKGPDDCWNWLASVYGTGYGVFNYNGSKTAHRAAYALFIGPIPEGLFVLHTCDNRLCCNPKHLFLGTSKDNVQDMIKKKRNVTWNKTSRGNILGIKSLLAYGLPQLEIANIFFVDQGTVSHIKTGYLNYV